MKKVNISIDEDLLKRLDDYCDANFTTRSGAISQGVNAILLQDEVRRSISRMAVAFECIAKTGTLSDEDKLALEQFQTLARVLSSNG